MPGVFRSHEISVQDHRLQYLSVAARYGSMRAAADILGIAPSSISRQVAMLERSLRIDLVEKGSHKMQLTEAGRILIDYYDRRTSEHQHLLTRLSSLRNARGSTVCIAVGEGLLTEAFMPVFRQVCEQHPDTNIDLVTASSDGIQRMIQDNEAQIGLLLERPSDVRLSVHARGAQPLRALMHPGHRLVTYKELDIDTIAAERLLMPGKETRLYEIMQSLLRQSGKNPEIVLTSTTLPALLEGAAMGMGLTLLPEILAMPALASGRVVARRICADDLEDISLHLVTCSGRRLREGGLALLQGMSSVVRQLLSDIKSGSQVVT